MPALDEPYVIVLKQLPRKSPGFASEFAALRASLTGDKISIEHIRAGEHTLCLRVRLPDSRRDEAVAKLRANPLVETIADSASAPIALKGLQQLEAFDGLASIPEDKLRGFRSKRRDLKPDLSSPHTNEILVRYLDADGAAPERLASAKGRVAAIHRRNGAHVLRSFPAGGSDIEVIAVPTGADFARVLESYQNSDDVDYAEPNYLGEKQTTPNDASFASQQDILNRIKAPQAWDVRTSSDSVVVAVLDSGMDMDHPDLVANLWDNPNEIADGEDNDRNGYIDDLHGINAATTSTGDPSDAVGHGTEVCGVLGARGYTGIGIAGVNWQTQVMPIRVYDAGGIPTVENVVRGIDYAISNGAAVAIASWTMLGYSQTLDDAVQNLTNRGIPLICAAKNESSDLDANPNYPSWYFGSNLLTVTASDNSSPEQIASNAQRGFHMVDVAAPGLGIYTTKLAGFVIEGPARRRVLIRALEPSLGYVFGIPGSLTDPQLELTSGGQSIFSNDNWRPSNNGFQRRVLSTGFAPFDDSESVVVATLDPGAYTVHLSGVGGATGVATIEVFEY